MLCGVCIKEVENSAIVLLKNNQTNKTRERKIVLLTKYHFMKFFVKFSWISGTFNCQYTAEYYAKARIVSRKKIPSITSNSYAKVPFCWRRLLNTLTVLKVENDRMLYIGHHREYLDLKLTSLLQTLFAKTCMVRSYLKASTLQQLWGQGNRIYNRIEFITE